MCEGSDGVKVVMIWVCEGSDGCVCEDSDGWVHEGVMGVCVKVVMGVCVNSLIPRPSPSFPSFTVYLTVLQATGSWAKAWELNKAMGGPG